MTSEHIHHAVSLVESIIWLDYVTRASKTHWWQFKKRKKLKARRDALLRKFVE